MSWITSYFWAKKVESPPPHRDEEFELVGHPFDVNLRTQTTSHHPTEERSFFDAIKETFELTYVSALQAGLHSRAFHVNLIRGEEAHPMMLQMIKIDEIRDRERRHRNFSLNHDHIGIDWHLFLPNSSPLPQPEYAIAWSIEESKFVVLTKEQINAHCSGEKPLDGEHVLYATLTPYQDARTPVYDHPLMHFDTYDTIAPFCPEGTHFPFVLASHLRNLKIENFLGKGSFSQVWAVTFTDPFGKPQRTTLRIPKTGLIENELQKQNYYQISRDRFGGEFGAFLPEGPYSINSYYAIVFDEKQQAFRILKRDEIRAFHDEPEKIGDNVYTLFGILGEYHEGARTLKDVMATERKFEIERVRTYAYQLLLALNEFKLLNVIHRDMKPDNILVLPNGNLKVFDFGFAATKVKAGEMVTSVLGSPLFMTHEVLEKDQYDHSVDRYAVYCILFQMATGEHPFPDVRTIEDLKRAVAAKIDPADDPRLASFPLAFRNLLTRLGHQKREERWEGDRILEQDEFLQDIPARPDPRKESSLPFVLTSILPRSKPPPAKPSGPSPSLAGRVGKLILLAGAAFVLYHIARRVLVLATRPRFPKGTPQ